MVAFGAILGAGTLYLINYILVTFRFERLQSFVSDLSYGAVLVIALLVSLLLPYVQRVTRGLSVMVFFILMSLAGLFVVLHSVYDQPIVVETEAVKDIDEASKAYERGQKVRKIDATGNIIVEEGEAGTTTGEGTAQGGSLAGHSVVRLTETPWNNNALYNYWIGRTCSSSLSSFRTSKSLYHIFCCHCCHHSLQD